MNARRYLLIALSLLLIAACTEKHPAQGSWRGMLVTQGNTFDMGKVIIGADYIEIPDIEQRFDHLEFTTASNETFFGRQKGGDVQASGDNAGPVANGSIKFLGDATARMTIDKLQGIVKLSR